MNRTATTVTTTANLTLRATALGLATGVTLFVLAALGHTADRQFDDVLLAQATACQPTQVVVITGKRLPKA